jgi:hypothetical protein
MSRHEHERPPDRCSSGARHAISAIIWAVTRRTFSLLPDVNLGISGNDNLDIFIFQIPQMPRKREKLTNASELSLPDRVSFRLHVIKSNSSHINSNLK